MKKCWEHRDFSGYKIVPAPQDIVDAFAPEMERLLLLIRKWMLPEDPTGWAASCWVSNESQLADFCLDESVVANLASDLGFPIERNMYLYEICASMRGNQA